MEYYREELFPCVSLTALQTDKFKTGCLSATLLTQLDRETAAADLDFLLEKLHVPALLAKIIVDGLLYLVSYRIQRSKVFGQSEKK